jgi:hypothetical protein
MAIYRKGEGQWTPEKQAGLIEHAKQQGEDKYRREGMKNYDTPHREYKKDLEEFRGWAIGANQHIKASNVTGPVSGSGIAKGKATRASLSPTLIERQNENAAANPDLKV